MLIDYNVLAVLSTFPWKISDFFHALFFVLVISWFCSFKEDLQKSWDVIPPYLEERRFEKRRSSSVEVKTIIHMFRVNFPFEKKKSI